MGLSLLVKLDQLIEFGLNLLILSYGLISGFYYWDSTIVTIYIVNWLSFRANLISTSNRKIIMSIFLLIFWESSNQLQIISLFALELFLRLALVYLIQRMVNKALLEIAEQELVSNRILNLYQILSDRQTLPPDKIGSLINALAGVNLQEVNLTDTQKEIIKVLVKNSSKSIFDQIEYLQLRDGVYLYQIGPIQVNQEAKMIYIQAKFDQMIIITKTLDLSSGRGRGLGESEETICGICRDQFASSSEQDHKLVANLPCKHKYCLQCIEIWYRSGDYLSCPICRN